ncbi:MAG: tetrahydrodipicolinate N-succinyltransferase N-terminal domain-containing protein, partial [SAR86 cluster bacterium]|nr:tetrahydrodipicolinate N-succinyltransferase N-terminal domain-containing protein [SAR86 cluster bacterium]
MNIFPLIAVGSGSMNNNGDLLDVRYQVIVTQKNEELHNPLGFAYENYSDLEAMLKDSPEGHSLKENFEKELSINKNKRLVILQINKDESVKNICDAYLKLYLLSLRIAKPNSLNLDGIFANLPNNA